MANSTRAPSIADWCGVYVYDADHGFSCDERASFNAEFLRSVWIVGIPALLGAAAITYLVSARWAERLWTSWLLTMPIGGLVILGYSLTTYFTR